MPDVEIQLNLKGRKHSLRFPSHRSLLDVLRDGLDLTGAKRGSDRGECGARTALLDGKPAYAGIIPVGRAMRRSVLTVGGWQPTDASILCSRRSSTRTEHSADTAHPDS